MLLVLFLVNNCLLFQRVVKSFYFLYNYSFNVRVFYVNFIGGPKSNGISFSLMFYYCCRYYYFSTLTQHETINTTNDTFVPYLKLIYIYFLQCYSHILDWNNIVLFNSAWLILYIIYYLTLVRNILFRLCSHGMYAIGFFQLSLFYIKKS